MLRRGITDTAFTILVFPTLPPYNKNANCKQMGHYQIKLEQYRDCKFWNSECLAIIQKKFPVALTALEIHPSILSANYMAHAVFEHIIANFNPQPTQPMVFSNTTVSGLNLLTHQIQTAPRNTSMMPCKSNSTSTNWMLGLSLPITL